MNQIITDVRISSYNEAAVRLIGSYDALNGHLSISEILPFGETDLSGKTKKEIEQIKILQRHSIVVVDSMTAFNKWDLHFNESEHLNFAVGAYYELERQKKLILGKEISSRYNLQNVIQVRKLEVTGNVYEINPEDTENAHIAILVSCWAALRARGVSAITNEEQEQATDQDIDDFLVPFSI